MTAPDTKTVEKAILWLQCGLRAMESWEARLDGSLGGKNLKVGGAFLLVCEYG